MKSMRQWHASFQPPSTGQRNFRDNMLRMDERKLSNNQNPLHNQKLMNDSIKEREAFDTFKDAPPIETLQPAGADDAFPEPYARSDGRYKRSGSLETLESEDASEFPKAYGRRTATDRRQMMNGLNMSAVTEASADPSPNTSSSILRNPYVNDERAIRRQLATEGGASWDRNLQCRPLQSALRRTQMMQQLSDVGDT